MGNGSSRQRTMPEGGGLSSAGSARKSSVNSILGINKKEKNSVSSVSAPATVMKKTFKDSYTLTKDLGTGAFSVVKLAIHKSTGKSTAVKIISKKKLSEEDLASLVTEISILCELNHPHIIKCYETFDEGAEFYIVTELVAGGELFDRIVAKTNYTEKEARDLIKMFLETMTYMHEEGVVHRDLKPENLLLCSESDDSDIKIADFGFAKRTVDLLANETACGTPGYVAPEILRGDKYGTEVDIWSMGVICYVLLAGYPPFYDEDQKKLFKKIKEGKYHFHQDYWSNTSPDAMDMIRKMLCVNQKDRWTARQLLSHAWITAGDQELQAKDLSKSIEAMKKYKAKMRFKAVAKAIMATKRMQNAFKVRPKVATQSDSALPVDRTQLEINGEVATPEAGSRGSMNSVSTEACPGALAGSVGGTPSNTMTPNNELAGESTPIKNLLSTVKEVTSPGPESAKEKTPKEINLSASDKGVRKEEKKRNKSVRKSNGIILGNIGQEVRESLTGSQDEMDESYLKSCID
eukprot:CAMPEP_0119051102 /NCGR_PEP_ID=MMETSP1177-20130426/72828_1 /TAXON_ID=2985 /ORGANISM="Ochromonas sp, Strain CCMP1899" /LENGTH=519 /DNA_ID=CAMNT_0007030195 /DNA_START=251 /DNA_END=1810 /DNA_ORIENTATION=+